mmetsp:Transcript_4559/g.10706  ORF Transcript_4559/g.10706 Transcript_4559/m.10706 type:complete len:96 (-) Transcript_4559:774-1061(-)|eukprot:1159508-Pelagomonas_calceolata.AAC.8
METTYDCDIEQIATEQHLHGRAGQAACITISLDKLRKKFQSATERRLHEGPGQAAHIILILDILGSRWKLELKLRDAHVRQGENACDGRHEEAYC